MNSWEVRILFTKMGRTGGEIVGGSMISDPSSILDVLNQGISITSR